MPRLVGFGWFAALLEEQISGAAFSPATNGGGPVGSDRQSTVPASDIENDADKERMRFICSSHYV